MGFPKQYFLDLGIPIVGLGLFLLGLGQPQSFGVALATQAGPRPKLNGSLLLTWA